MDKTVQNPTQQSASNKRRMMDFVPSKPISTSRQSADDRSKGQDKPITALHQEAHNAKQDNSNQASATPVTSAKAAINARFANQTQTSSAPRMVTSAREAVNTAANAPGSPKSAAHLHHGSIQDNMNMRSVRTSASAILQRTSSAPKPPRIIESKNSYDPLAHVPSAAQQSSARLRPAQDISSPVVKTSLQLNRNMRPKQSPVILPADSAKGTKRLSSLLAAQKQRATTRPAPNPAYRGASAMRDSQMTNRRTYSAQDFARQQAIKVAQNAKMADIIDSKLGAPGRRIEPIVVEDADKPRTPSHESIVANDINRIAEATIAERVPQSLEVKRVTPETQMRGRRQPSELGVVEDHADYTARPRPSGRSVTAQMVESRVAPGSHNFQADNNPTYSFSRPKGQDSRIQSSDKRGKNDNKSKSSGKNRYSATEKSPFLKSVQVDKRPLSDSSIPPQPTVINTGLTSRSERKKEVKRVKAKQQQNLPSRPTVIIPASRRSRAPLFFLILLTVILGAIVGTATYFFFFNEF